MSATVTERSVVKIITGQATSDGAGVRLSRVIGTPALDHFDPFLLLDEFKSDKPDDYLAGFPDHPHRGFETVTYMLAGSMRHKDHVGNQGELVAGSVQWMTAGRGIIHSEMPIQKDGLMWGFQLWVNLPARDKMTAPRYQDIPPDKIPEVALADGGGTEILSTGQLAVLGDGARLSAAAVDGHARFLLLAARPLREPIARYGPFVMNTREEIVRAVEDYQRGALLG